MHAPEHFAALASAQGAEDGRLVGIPHATQRVSEVSDVEGRQEAESPHGEAHNRRKRLVRHKEGGKVEHCAIPP